MLFAIDIGNDIILTISLAIYDDRIEIASPGTFPPQITPENIKEPHESYPHNLKVAEALYRMTYLENWDSGARRIMDACQAQGVENPTWYCDGGFVIITFKRPHFKTSIMDTGKHPKKYTLRSLGFDCSFAFAKTIKP